MLEHDKKHPPYLLLDTVANGRALLQSLTPGPLHLHSKAMGLRNIYWTQDQVRPAMERLYPMRRHAY